MQRAIILPSPRVLAMVALATFATPTTSAAQTPAGAPYPRPAGAHEVVLERAVMVPMRDGVRLATDIYRPKDSVSVAALHVSSWFDLAGEALVEAEIFRKNGVNDRARSGQYAIISPTTHCASERSSSQTKAGDLVVVDARLHYDETYLAWFDC